MREQHERMIDTEFREAVVDAAVAEAKIEVPASWCTRRRTRCGTRPGRRLAARASTRRATSR